MRQDRYTSTESAAQPAFAAQGGALARERSGEHVLQPLAPSQAQNALSIPYWLMGLPLDCFTMEQAKARIIDAARHRTPLVFATPNVNFFAQARRNPEFHNTLLRADMSLMDSMPMTWLARLLGVPVPERVAGASLVESFLADRTSPQITVYFFGGAPGVAEQACRAVNRSSGPLKAVGYFDPGFVSVEEMSTPQILEHINASQADMLIIALGAEKGHLWIERNRHQLTVPIISHLGAVINFLSGTVKRAPGFVQRLGMEWLWRIWQEPKLARRYLRDSLWLGREMTIAFFVLAVARLRARRGAKLRLDVRQTGSATTLALQGALTRHSVPVLQKALEDLQQRSDTVLLNIDGVTTMDSRALGYLYALFYRSDDKPAARAPRLVCSNARLLKRHRAIGLLREAASSV